MKINNFFKNRTLWIIILLSIVIRLLYFADYHELWWDSGVYAGMGKYLLSGGQAGLWEHIRPPLWPIALGLIWFLKLNIILLGKFFQLALSIGCIVLVYAIAKRYFDERTGLIAAAMFSFSSIFFYLGFHLYTEIPATFLVLLAVYFFSNSRYFIAGIFTGLAFLAKFPAGMFIAILGATLLIDKKVKNAIDLAVGFALPMIAFLIANFFAYGNAILPLIDARKTILSVLGCNVLHYKPWYQYLGWIASDNFLNVFLIAGIFFVFKPWKKKYLLLLLSLIIPLLYFMQLNCRDYRYAMILLPFAAIFAAYGLSKLFKKQHIALILALVLAISIAGGTNFYLANEPLTPDETHQQYISYPVKKGEIWTSNPLIAFYSNEKLNKIYYPVWNEELAKSFNNYLSDHSEKISMVLIDTCDGGIICGDEACKQENKQMNSFLNENFQLPFNKTSGVCEYRIYQK